MSSDQILGISYCRKSTMVKGKSIEENVGYQRQLIQEYAIQNRIHIVREFSDVGYSGKNADRPELTEIVEYLKSSEKKIDELVIYSIDCFGRDMQHNIRQMLEILQLVEKVSFVSQSISSDSTYFKLLFLTLTAVAQDERERLLSRYAGGRREKVITRRSFDGNYYPLGLVKDQESECLVAAKPSKVVDIEKNKELIQLQYIYYLYLYNFSLRKIASILNDKFGKTKRGASWSYKSVKYILQNPVYSGKLKGVLEKSNHYLIDEANVEKIIDSTTYTLIQCKLNFEKTGRKRKDIVRNPFLNLCYRCGNYLVVDNNGHLSCTTCKKSVDSTKIVEEIKRQMMQIIKNKYKLDHYPTNEHILSIRDIESEKLREVIIDIKKLQLRLEEIKSLETSETTKNRMIRINTVEIQKLYQEKQLIEVKLEFFN